MLAIDQVALGHLPVEDVLAMLENYARRLGFRPREGRRITPQQVVALAARHRYPHVVNRWTAAAATLGLSVAVNVDNQGRPQSLVVYDSDIWSAASARDIVTWLKDGFAEADILAMLEEYDHKRRSQGTMAAAALAFLLLRWFVIAHIPLPFDPSWEPWGSIACAAFSALTYYGWHRWCRSSEPHQVGSWDNGVD